MIIKLTAVNDCMIGGKFPGKEIEGVRIDNGERWGKNFFADKRELRNQLEEFGLGDVLNIKLVQDGKFWNIESITEASEALIQKAQEYGAKAGTTGPPTEAKGKAYTSTSATSTKGSDKMSKAEWAEKDRKAKIGYSIHNSIAAAAQVNKVGTSPEKLVEYATKLLPYLMLEELPGKFDESVFVEDALTPPTGD